MIDWLITVEGEGATNPHPRLTIRTTNESEDFANGVVVGLKSIYSERRVFKNEIK
tara:strand:+ start:18502 stop:18666 length:165 start_codon:yes stop_codon:yes gene_type:complete